MAFLNPLLLFGAFAVSIPIIIHLLNKRKFERVVWAAMKFLRISVEKNQRRIQIEDMILLALRCLLLALLALALARPAIKAAGAGRFFGQSPVTGVLVIDNSYSMSATDGVQQRFDQAKAAADSIIDTLPPGSKIAVILGSDIANPIIPEPTYDLNLVRQTIHNARLSGRSTDAAPWLRSAMSILDGFASLRKEIYVITDGQLNGWDKLEDIHNQLEQTKADVHTQIVLVGSKLDANVGVTDLHLTTDFPVIDQPLSFSATVRNYGNDPSADARNVRVSLRVDDDPTTDETVIDLLKAGESKTLELTAKLHTIGTHTLTVSIPIETDRLPADDSRTVAVRAMKDIHVLMVDGDQGAGGMEASTYALRTYLVLVPTDQEDQYFMKVSTIAPANLENQRLDEYSAIIFSNVTDLSQGTLDNLANYLRRGLGGLIVFPGHLSSARFYNDVLVNKYHFLPASLGAQRGNADVNNDSIYFKLQGTNLTSEVARMWGTPGSGTPTTIKFWRAFELIADSTLRPRPDDKAAVAKDPYMAEAGVPQVDMSFGQGVGDASLDGQPAIMERQWGQGRVFEFASTADRKWNTLPLDYHVYFPLFRKILGIIVRRQDDALNIKVGDKFVYHPSDDMLGKDALIYPPGQKQQAVDSRRVELVNRLPEIAFDAVDNAGEYKVEFAGGPAAGGSAVKFAAYPDERESELAELGPAEIQRLSEAATVTHWTPGESLGAKIEKDRVGTELWTMLVTIALLLAAAETFLGHWFSRTK